MIELVQENLVFLFLVFVSNHHSSWLILFNSDISFPKQLFAKFEFLFKIPRILILPFNVFNSMQSYKTLWNHQISRLKFSFSFPFYIFITALTSDVHRISYFLFNIWNTGHVKTYKESHFNTDKVHSLLSLLKYLVNIWFLFCHNFNLSQGAHVKATGGIA